MHSSIDAGRISGRDRDNRDLGLCADRARTAALRLEVSPRGGCLSNRQRTWTRSAADRRLTSAASPRRMLELQRDLSAQTTNLGVRSSNLFGRAINMRSATVPSTAASRGKTGSHEMHDGRYGWWWDVDGAWHFYEEPIYPYPG